MGCVLFDGIPDERLPATRLVRTRSSGAASQTAQPATVSSTPGEIPASTPGGFRAGVVGVETTRATACAYLRRELSGEPDAGNLHVRFDEGRMSQAWAALTLLLYRLGRERRDSRRSHGRSQERRMLFS